MSAIERLRNARLSSAQKSTGTNNLVSKSVTVATSETTEIRVPKKTWLEKPTMKGEFACGEMVTDHIGRNLVVSGNLSTQYSCSSLDGEREYFYFKNDKYALRLTENK